MNRFLALSLGTAAVFAVILIGLNANNIAGPGPSPSPSPEAPTETPAPTESPLARADRVFSPADLARIVLVAGSLSGEDPVLGGLLVDDQQTGITALVQPLPEGSEGFDESGFADALMTNLNSTDSAGYVSWAAVFDSITAGDLAFHFLQGEHERTSGWGLEPQEGAGLGFESVLYVGSAYGWDSATIHLWRESNLVLAAVGVGAHDPSVARTIAAEMDARRQAAASAVAVYACRGNPAWVMELHRDGELTLTDATGGFSEGTWSVSGDTMTITVDGEDSFYLIDGDRLIGEVSCSRMS